MLFRSSDDGTQHLKKALRDYDSLSVFGPDFTLWGYHSGGVAWSEYPGYIKLHRKLLNELQACAIVRGPKEVTALLKDLAQVALKN